MVPLRLVDGVAERRPVHGWQVLERDYRRAGRCRLPHPHLDVQHEPRNLGLTGLLDGEAVEAPVDVGVRAVL
ncbi:hypothetical protein ACFQH8_09930 [Halomicroarcula sp. GCM10025710]